MIATQGSGANPDNKASTFESKASPRNFRADIFQKSTPADDSEAFVVERPPDVSSESRFYKEPDPRRLPPSQRAPVLRNVTNISPTYYVPAIKVSKLDDLNEPPLAEFDTWGLDPSNREYYSLAGRGCKFTSTRIQRPVHSP